MRNSALSWSPKLRFPAKCDVRGRRILRCRFRSVYFIFIPFSCFSFHVGFIVSVFSNFVFGV